MEIHEIDQKRHFIESLYSKNWKYNNLEQANNQANSLDIISSDIYTETTRFIVELLQNCDDSSFDYEHRNLDLTFRIMKNCLIISHNGKPFDQADIASLCSTGNSTKHKKNSTGYKGIGFKSVFYQSKKVDVISNKFRIRFDKDYFTPERCWQPEFGDFQQVQADYAANNMKFEVKKPWQIIPRWILKDMIPDEYLKITDEHNVNFIIYHSNPEVIQQWKKAIYEIEKDHMYFLFLKSQDVKIKIYEDDELKRSLEEISMITSNGIIKHVKSGGENLGVYFIKNVYFPLNKIFTGDQIDTIRKEEHLPQKLKDSENLEISFAANLIYIKDNQLIVTPIAQDKRLIYAFLPTRVNFNFPFLINSNFMLDASRTQLKEDLWNTLLLFNLPAFIFQFYESLFLEFGNSFANVLITPKDININCPKFSDPFIENLQIEKNHYGNHLRVKTKKGEIKPLEKCFSNQFRLESFNKIEDYFQSKYGSSFHVDFLKFYFSSKNIDFKEEFEILDSDLPFIKNIAAYFNHNYYTVTHLDVIDYLKTTFKNWYESKVCYKFLLSIYENKSLFDKNLFNDNFKVIKTKTGDYCQPNSCLVYLTQNSEVLDILEVTGLLKELKGENETFGEMDLQLANIFINKENIDVLRFFDVKVFDEDFVADSILNGLAKINKPEYSVNIIRFLFRKWLEDGGAQDDKNNKKIKRLSEAKLLANSGEFLPTYLLNIGKFYTGSDINKQFYQFSVSDEYFKDDLNNEKGPWVEFFYSIGMLKDQQAIKLNIPTDHILKLPYFAPDYIQLLNSKRSRLTAKYEIIIYPYLNSIWSDENKITGFFSNFIFDENEKEALKNTRVNNSLDNYLIWSIKQHRKIVNTRGEICNVEDLFSHKVIINLEKHTHISKEHLGNLLTETLNFFDEDLENYFLKGDVKLKNILSDFDRIVLMKKIQGGKFRKELMEVYKNLFYYLITHKKFAAIITYNGKLLDEDNNFVDSAELCYVDKTLELFLEHLVRDKKKLKCEGNGIRNHLDFCEKCGVRVYRENSLKLKALTNPKKNETLYQLMINLINHILNIGQILYKENFKSESVRTLIPSIYFYSCQKIILETSYKEQVDSFIYEKDQSNQSSRRNIYYIQDDVYTSWNHPTILYFICQELEKLFNCPGISTELQPLLKLESEEQRTKFISKILY